jgi:lon-related putative ATP-dependent protease
MVNAVKPLPPEALFHPCDPDEFDFETTEKLEDLVRMVGQDRAVEAVRFGAAMPVDGYNLFVLGPSGTGRHRFVREFLAREAGERPVAPDWCYVNNFAEPHKPRALELPAGRGTKLRDDVEALIAEVQTAIPAAFETEDYHTRRQSLERGFQEEQSRAFEEAQNRAEARGIRIIQTPTGVTFAPVRDGAVVTPEEFHKLPEDEQKRLEEQVEAVGKDFQSLMQDTPKRIRRLREQLRELDREVTVFAVGSLIEDMVESYGDMPEVVEYLKEMQDDLIENADLFRASRDETQNLVQLITGAGARAQKESDPTRRYGVNLLVSNAEADGAPVVVEDHPAYVHLIGRIEHRAHLGTLVTDFQQIKAGALHRANHGYLVLDARKVLMEPFAWSALKQTLRSRCIRIESLGQAYSMVSTVSLEPEPIPLELKVVLIGERMLYYLLEALDPEFSELFKVAADFDDRMPRSHENQQLLAQLLGTVARREGLKPLHRSAVARVIEESARYAGDAERLSAEVRRAADIVREAHSWASEDGNDYIAPADVERAIDARDRRQSRVRDRMQEEILRGTLLIDSEGAREGQINGLAVSQVGQYTFGHPTRITARLTVGSGKVIDIEREVELGGPLHSKGVLILSGFLASHYVTDRPLSFSATLVFEQSYGGVEGDSASSAELYALLSALARVPIKQGLAVTGSVNQYGQVQAIGGVNEKIEGFFDVCDARGLSGEQGVIIPMANVKHLMLRRKVVDAVADGKFHVYPVETIDQGMQLLCAMTPGERDARGEFPEGTINHRITQRLIELAESRRAFASEQGGEEAS